MRMSIFKSFFSMCLSIAISVAGSLASLAEPALKLVLSAFPDPMCKVFYEIQHFMQVTKRISTKYSARVSGARDHVTMLHALA
jgi:hypothetical protein